MGVGTLINKFCADTRCSAADVKDIYQKYSNNLGSCKPTTRLHEDKVIERNIKFYGCYLSGIS